MTPKQPKTVIAETPAQRSALASPLRLEIIGLFAEPGALSIADMARRMGRPAGSLYHHVGVLEKAGLLQRAGTRPKGKRHEALFRPAGQRIALKVEPGNEQDIDHAVRTLSASFRMTVRDLEAALRNPNTVRTGPDRDLSAARIHFRATPATLRKLNDHLQAIEDLLRRETDGTAGRHYSLTLALLPLRGRSGGSSEEEPS
jgi:DNA-binding transcriptional ArsR family regulator